MNLSDMITRVADDASTNGSLTGVKARIIRHINRICSEQWGDFRWSFRWRNYRIVTDVDVTGTASVSNGSRSIAGSGFLSTHVGWHIYFPSDANPNWYKIGSYTSATQLELDVPYQGTSGSRSYVLRHIDYTLPTEPWDIGSIVVTADGTPVNLIDQYSIDLVAAPNTNGSPLYASIYGSDDIATTYTTGTVTGTINTVTLTGSGTSWLANVYPGDQITIGSYTYTVRKVDSDTQITLYNKQQIASAGATYTITRQFGRVLRILWPSVLNYTIDIRALRMYAPLVNDSDSNEFLWRYPNAVALKAAALELKSHPDKRAMQLDQEAELAWAKARADDETLTPKEQVKPIFSYRIGRTRF